MEISIQKPVKKYFCKNVRILKFAYDIFDALRLILYPIIYPSRFPHCFQAPDRSMIEQQVNTSQ